MEVWVANPQLTDGYLKIANPIISALQKIRISGEEWQILLVVLRQTYGYNKKEDAISLGQFSKYTGIKRPNIARAIKKLLSKKILETVIIIDNSYITTYRFNKDFEQWRPVVKKDTTVVNNDNTLLSKKITVGVVNNDTHKRQYIKDNNTKDKRLTTMSVSDPYFSFSPEAFQKLWNETLVPHGFSRCTTLDHKENNKLTTKTRLQLIKDRLKEKSCPSYWLYIFSKILDSSFCRGENDRNWKANIDWLIRPTTHTKIAEGKYDEKSVVAPPY